jgi:deoxyribonuclease IV
MPLLGAHMSIAGGLPLAVDRAVLHRCQALQIFAKNASQWRGRDIPAVEVQDFRRRVERAGLTRVVSHASYLINLATTSYALRQQSLAAMGDEIDRAEALGLLGVVLHPGCYTHGTDEQGLTLVAQALVGVLAARPRGRAMVLLEHTAGQGTALGRTFEQLAAIIDQAGGHHRLGVCLDTCHLLASGYDIASPAGYKSTFRTFERTVGLDRLRAFHVNDSRMPLGSRVDRHTHIGQGCVGIEPFRWLVNDRRFRDLPMLLETPKTSRRSAAAVALDQYDEQNLNTLRGLIERRVGIAGRTGARRK